MIYRQTGRKMEILTDCKAVRYIERYIQKLTHRPTDGLDKKSHRQPTDGLDRTTHRQDTDRLDRARHRQQTDRLDRASHRQQTDRPRHSHSPALTACGVEGFVQRGDLHQTRHGGLVGDVGQQQTNDAVQAGVSHGRGGGGHRGTRRRPGPVDQPVDSGLGVAPHRATQEGGLVGLWRVQPLDRGRGEASWGSTVWIMTIVLISLWRTYVACFSVCVVILS